MGSTTHNIKTCKHCNKTYLIEAEQKFHQFCSERCKLNDLHNWLSGSYFIVGRPIAPNSLEDQDLSK